MPSVVRVLRWYEKPPDDRFVGVAVLARAKLAELQALFSVPPDNPMYDCWPVGPVQVIAISEMAGVAVDLDRFVYMVEADAGDEK